MNSFAPHWPRRANAKSRGEGQSNSQSATPVGQAGSYRCTAISLARAHLGRVMPSLHPEQHVHMHVKGLLNTQGHLRRQARIAVQQGRERCPADSEYLGGFRYGETQFLDDLRANEVARMRGSCSR